MCIGVFETAKKCEVRSDTIKENPQYNTPEGALAISKGKRDYKHV